MASTKPVFLGATTTRVGESASFSISIPTEPLVLGQKMGFLKSTEVPNGYVNISSIQMRYNCNGTGNLYLKFACSHTAAATGATTTEDVDTYTVYAAGTSGKMVNVTVPASAYNGLSGMVAGDVLSVAVYRDDSVATDTYTSDLEVVGFSVIFSTGANAEVGDGDRSKKILGKVMLALTGNIDLSAKTALKIPEVAIYDIMKDYSVKIAQETKCLEKSGTLTVTSSETTEPTGFFRLKLIELTSTLTLQPVEIDIEDYDNLNRQSFSGVGQTPLYYKRWNGTITFNPTVATASYPIYYWGIPTTIPSSTTDPETPEKFDGAITYGVLSELFVMYGRVDLANMYDRKYEIELNKCIVNQGRTQSRMLQIQSHE